jgi:threonine aldolase
MLGGGWRQAGIIASMGLVALEQNWIQRLDADHCNAKSLARGLMEKKDDLPIDVATPDTNILLIGFTQKLSIEKLYAIVEELNERGILCFDMGPRIRLVTHYGINEDDITYSIPVIHQTIQKYFH